MSDPTASAVTVIEPPASAAPADPLSTIVGDMKAQAIEDYAKNPDGVGSARVQTVLSYENVQQQQQIAAQLATIAAAFKPATPVGPFPESLGHAAAVMARALQNPFLELRQENFELHREVEKLKSELEHFKAHTESQFALGQTAVAKDIHGLREAQRAQEQMIVRIITFCRGMMQHMQVMQRTFVKVLRTVHGWEEKLAEEVDKSFAEIVILDVHDDARGGKRRT